ncbi:MAG TPA: hypothetical protein VIX86_19440 [Streptosporangiaceae bacterium]|jgi:hypothetical protein
MRDQDESDSSGSTAQFRAFVDRSRGVDASQPWTMSAPRNQVAKLAVIVVAVAAVLAVIAFLVIG